MNKYYIKKYDEYGFCIRFKKLENVNKFSIPKLEISGLYFVDYFGISVSNDKKLWGWNKAIYDTMNISHKENIFEFETDEEALLCFEVIS